MSKEHLILSENDIARIINGEEVIIKLKDKEFTIRQSHLKDTLKDSLVRGNRILNTTSNTFEY